MPKAKENIQLVSKSFTYSRWRQIMNQQVAHWAVKLSWQNGY